MWLLQGCLEREAQEVWEAVRVGEPKGLPANQPQLDGFSISGSVISNTLQQGDVGGSEELPVLRSLSFFPHHRGQVGA